MIPPPPPLSSSSFLPRSIQRITMREGGEEEARDSAYCVCTFLFFYLKDGFALLCALQVGMVLFLMIVVESRSAAKDTLSSFLSGREEGGGGNSAVARKEEGGEKRSGNVPAFFILFSSLPCLSKDDANALTRSSSSS